MVLMDGAFCRETTPGPEGIRPTTVYLSTGPWWNALNEKARSMAPGFLFTLNGIQ
jgi:hypothetical protein